MTEHRSPTEQVTAWLAAFEAALAARDIAQATRLFAPSCYWRDMVAFTWNIKTMEGPDAIADMLAATLADTAPRNWRIDGTATTGDNSVEALITFETRSGVGRGHVRLVDGKCWTLLTTLTELKGHEEKVGHRRAKGTTHGPQKARRTWLDAQQSDAAELGVTRQPYCLIIGGGQGGIALAARLRRLQVPTIVLEKNAKAGDSWRNRYDSLVLHDPVWYDHLPYLPFPDDWPVFAPKDKFGDWLEMYVRVMELNYWTTSEAVGARYDPAEAEWSVEVRRDGEPLTLRPKQLVFATGAYGPPKDIALPGRETFNGVQLHSSEYVNGDAFAGKRCVVIGSGSSGHDIAMDLWEHGASVTMVQRSPTIVVPSDTLMEEGFAGLYSEDAVASGITTDIADLKAASLPFGLLPRFQKMVTDRIRARDAAFYDRLEKAGFLVSFGADETGLMMQAMRTASNYYIDVGCSHLIAEGEVALKSGVDIRGIDADAIVFDDDTRLPADVIVYATGFRSMDAVVADLISPEVAGKVGPLWGLGSGIRNDPGPWLGELRNMWKPTAQPGLWFHGGNLALSRFHSLHLALQIKARMAGIETPVYGGP